MKKLITIVAFLSTILAFAQPSTAVWKTEVKQISDTEFDIIFNVSIKEHFHLYSQFLPEGGAQPTLFTYANSKNNYKLIGKTKESKTIKKFDEVFGMDMTYFEKSATFTQRISLINKNLVSVIVDVEYQTCDDKSCTFDSETFTIKFPNISETVTVVDNTSVAQNPTPDSVVTAKINNLKLDIKDADKFTTEVSGKKENVSFWKIFVLGFLGGLVALLTPCVFPMIPLTVSFFTKRSKDKAKGKTNAFLYGFFIVLIYVLLSLPFHFLDSLDPEILNNISTNTWLNVIFFAIFMFFAFSFFGYYELTLPASWGNKMDSASDVGGIIGIFFMALTLAIVSFSCTGPILGSLLAGSLTTDGGATQLTVGMGGFGLALALPFALFALFPSWLNSLPKSGGWLNTVKVVLGFLEVALALKFLSNADLVEHWGLIKRELFIGIWIVVFAGMALYLFGLIRFPHDSHNQKIGKPRLVLGILTTIFVLYMLPGLTNTKYANLKLLSGFPPPMFYSYYEQESNCPLRLNCFKDFDEGLAYAKAHNKPILLDFTGWACVNCRKMEENVWSTPEVFEVINNNYVLISLYVDDRKELPKDQQFKFTKENGNIKKIKTVGDKWATLQAVNFHTASQPFYVVLSPDLEMLNTSKEYTNKTDYLQWLKTGIENFKKK